MLIRLLSPDLQLLRRQRLVKCVDALIDVPKRQLWLRFLDFAELRLRKEAVNGQGREVLALL